GGREALLRGPAALAPAPSSGGGGGEIGEVSAAAEAFGVRAGMRLGEALARCPQLTLVPPDPAGVAEAWEHVLGRLESIGAAVAPERPGLVCFEERGLRGLHGGTEGVIAAARRALRRPGGAWARLRARRAAAPAPAGRAPDRIARAGRVGLWPPARARAGAADRSPAGPPRAPRAHPARGRADGDARRRRNLAGADDIS